MRKLSETKEATRTRERRFKDPEFAKKARERDKRYAGRQQIKSILIRANANAEHTASLLKRVRLHLSKGRDAADIAVREFLPVSKVIKAIEYIRSVDVA